MERRNDYAHGDWFIGWAPQDAESMNDPSLWRTKPGRKAKPFQVAAISVKMLGEHADNLVELRQLVGDFGAVCFRDLPAEILAGARVRDVFEIEGSGKVIRREDAPMPRMSWA